MTTLKQLAKEVRNNRQPDSLYYKGHYYVMDYYDQEGKHMSYGSKSAKQDIEIYTPNNRYNKNYKDMEISVSEKTSYNNYVNYEE